MKTGRKKYDTPKLDMNPMVDLAFLLVTFFMLTTTFKTDEPVDVSVPASHADVKLPGQNLILITVSDDGRIFFRADGKHTKKRVLELMGTKYETDFTEAEKEAFSLAAGLGVPMADLKDFLATDLTERREIEQAGIPADSSNNQLEDWIVHARMANPMYRVAVKGDQNAPYKTMRKVINTLVDNGVSRFNLVTDMEKEI